MDTSPTHKSAESVIQAFNLKPHPEGGFFRELYRSTQNVHSSPVDGERSALTHIYFLLRKGDISRFHKVEHDEIWNVYEGAPIKLVHFDSEAGTLQEEIIGHGCENYCTVIERKKYQAAESTGEYTLVGCSVGPGFDFKDFAFIDGGSDQAEFIKKNYPDYQRFL